MDCENGRLTLRQSQSAKVYSHMHTKICCQRGLQNLLILLESRDAKRFDSVPDMLCMRAKISTRFAGEGNPVFPSQRHG